MKTSNTVGVTQQHGFPNARYFVEVRAADGSSTAHAVALSEQQYKHITGSAVLPDKLVELSFRFLLEREPKEAILASFDLAIIGQYFPEYNTVIEEMVQHELT